MRRLRPFDYGVFAGREEGVHLAAPVVGYRGDYRTDAGHAEHFGAHALERFAQGGVGLEVNARFVAFFVEGVAGAAPYPRDGRIGIENSRSYRASCQKGVADNAVAAGLICRSGFRA